MPTPDFNRPDNIHVALTYDSLGNPALRTTITDGVTISGPITIPSNLGITSIGTSGTLTVPYMPIGGNITLDPSTNTIGLVGQSGTWNVNVLNYPAVQPISGTVDIGTIPEVEIKNDVGNPIPVSGVLDAIIQGSPTVTFQPTSLDAFGRLRISNPVTLFDSSLRYHERHDFDTATANGGTLTYDFNASVRRLTVTNQAGSQVIRESLRVFPYQPGKSLLILNSFIMAPATSGLQQRLGYFTTNNGIYFDQTNTTKSFVIRSYSSGAITEESIPQSQWNGDKLDGTGPSGITLDLTASQIFWIDIE